MLSAKRSVERQAWGRICLSLVSAERSKTVLDYVKSVEATVRRYGGESEDKIVASLLGSTDRPLDAFVAQEQLVVRFNQTTEGERLVALYPKDGTFVLDHPLALLAGPWVTPEQRASFHLSPSTCGNRSSSDSCWSTATAPPRARPLWMGWNRILGPITAQRFLAAQAR
ncbi:MAG: hypothetical protein ACYC3S_15155 [Chloroflexota bacterium]